MDHTHTTCFACGTGRVQRRMWIDREGIPPGDEGHNITYTHALLYVCQECGAGYIEKLDHDCFDYEEVWDQYEWYTLAPNDVARLLAHLSGCPSPLTPGCPCPIHRAMRTATADLPRRAWNFSTQAQEHIRPVRLNLSGDSLRFDT